MTLVDVDKPYEPLIKAKGREAYLKQRETEGGPAWDDLSPFVKCMWYEWIERGGLPQR